MSEEKATYQPPDAAGQGDEQRGPVRIVTDAEAAANRAAENERQKGPEARLQAAEERAERAEAQAHPEITHRCDDCGGPHIVDTSLLTSVWNQVAEPQESLCTLCIDNRLQAKGLTAVARFYYAGEALVGKLYDADAAPEVLDWSTQAHKHAMAAAEEYQRAERLEGENVGLRVALMYIAKSPCHDFPSGGCEQHDGTELWCDPCTARAALTSSEESHG